jgi:hypothetical protein
VTGDDTVVEGTPYTLHLGELVDPGSDLGVIPVLEYVVDWGDGSVETFTSGGDVQHSFVDGLFNNLVSVDVITAGGTFVDVAQLDVQVLNAAPEITGLSLSVAGLPDLNGDNVVNIYDISIVSSSYGADPASNPLYAAADLNGDGMIDMADINIVLGAYGQTVTPSPAQEVGVGTFAAGGTAYVEGLFSDLGLVDAHDVSIDWGDGTTTVASVTQGAGEGSFFGRHTYTQGGVFKVTVTVSDSEDEGTAATLAYVTGVAVHDGLLHIVGTGGGDSVTVTRNASDPDMIDVNASFLAGGARTFALAGLTGAVVFAGDGDDDVTVDDDIVLPFLLVGGGGDDDLAGGAGDDVLIGGANDDDLAGGGGDDLLIGGANDDDLAGGEGNDALVGGANDDDLDGGAGNDGAFFNGDAADYDVDNNSVDAVMPGLDGDNRISRVEDILFEDSADSLTPGANPWAEELIARLKGPAQDVDEDDVAWLIFD